MAENNSVQNGHQTPIIHVEILQKLNSTTPAEEIKKHVVALLKQSPQILGDTAITTFEDTFLQENIESVSVCDTDCFQFAGQVLDLLSADVRLYVYRLQDEGPAEEELDDEDLAAASHWLLPALDFHGLWESLVFDSEIKSQLLQYASTTMLFSDRKVDTNIISWNRVILLHGPPGTGKTSLCKALAQKLCIQLSDRYRSYGQLIEINSHSLFSKWFSESGKLVMKMFQKIQELIDDQDALVCVLIDEVESLTAARKAALSGTEPSDAIRVVNAVLTQLDQIKKNPNVLILTTSNITGAIDLAFVDRADIKQYIGPPSPRAIYQIYRSCIVELMRTQIIQSEQLLELKKLELFKTVENNAVRLSLRLKEVAIKSQGLSGRALRKLPFIAHSLHIKANSCSLDTFLDALSLAVDKQFKEQKELSNS